MSYKFTGCELIDIKHIVDANGEWGIRQAFYWWNEVAKDKKVETEEVEDFAIAFMSQYNEQFGVTY